MGNTFHSSSPEVNPDHEFFVVVESSTLPYPGGNAEFKRRVSQSEWDDMKEEISRLLNRGLMYIYGVMGISAVSFIFAAVVNIAIIALWFVAAAAFVYLTCQQRRIIETVVAKYNKALFKPRGVLVKFIFGGKHSVSRLHVKMAYPANAQSANTLSFGSDDDLIEADCPELENKFRNANAEFSRSAAATALGPSQAPVQTNVIQVQVPPNAPPGSTVQVVHNGTPINVVVPPNVLPGQLITVSVVPAASSYPSHFQQDPGLIPMVQPTAISTTPGYAPLAPGYAPSTAGYTPSAPGYGPSASGYTPLEQERVVSAQPSEQTYGQHYSPATKY